MGNLVWLASYPKSGTTWLRAFLHNVLTRAERPYDINRLGDFSAGESAAELYRHFDDRPASQYSIDEVQRMRPLVHRELTRAFPDLVFVKTHNAVLTVRGVPLLSPEVTAGAIYLVRDPRDVAVSYSHHLGRSIDQTIALMADPAAMVGGDDRNVFERLAGWSIHVHSWTRAPKRSIAVARYEDLLAAPVETFGHLLAFLGIEAPRERLDAAIAFSAFPVLQAQERRAGFIERPAAAAAFFRSGGAGAWRHHLSPAQAARIERDHGEEMRRFGYC